MKKKCSRWMTTTKEPPDMRTKPAKVRILSNRDYVATVTTIQRNNPEQCERGEYALDLMLRRRYFNSKKRAKRFAEGLEKVIERYIKNL